jgi:hypothetical protein
MDLAQEFTVEDQTDRGIVEYWENGATIARLPHHSSFLFLPLLGCPEDAVFEDRHNPGQIGLGAEGEILFQSELGQIPSVV